MPTSEAFFFFYNFGFSPPASNINTSVYPAVTPASTSTLQDLVDGSTNVGETIQWDLGGLPVNAILYGFHDAGNPVFVYNGTYYALSNSGTLGGNIVASMTTSGTYVYCFGAGTLIATPDGACVVEDLRIGQKITTADGASTRVKWIGRQTRSKLFSGPRMQPVRIRAGALGGGLPFADLTVTGDHGMILDSLVINASALVNGATIDWVPLADLPDRVTYYHVETEAHEVILANGAASETYVDIPSRAGFDNYAEYLDLYGEDSMVEEMHRLRISSQRLVPQAIRTRLGIAGAAFDMKLLLGACPP